MPSWGRPSGARQTKKRKDRGVYTRHKEEDLRFEELDNDSGDGEGLNLDSPSISDALHFTGADLGAHMRSRQGTRSRRDSESSDEGDINNSGNPEALVQLALRDKEEVLVQKALERIRRAQLLGKTKVELSQPELDALERKSRKDQSERKTSRTNLRLTDRRRSSGTSSPAAKENKSGKKSRKSPLTRNEQGEVSSADYTTAPPGLLLSGHEGPSYAPLGYYPSADPLPQNVHLDSRLSNSPHQQQVQSKLPQHTKIREQHKRNSAGSLPVQQAPFSGKPDRSRRLPDDPGWSPRPRSVSSNQPHYLDPYQYQQYSPPLPHMPTQYTQNRRIVSGPPDVQYPDVQYLSTHRAAFPIQQPHAASSEPSLLQRERSGARQAQIIASDEDDSADSEDNGVQATT